MSVFSKTTVELLTSAGWEVGRTVDISAIEAKLTKGGFDIFPAVRDFLTKFGNLWITFPMELPHRTRTYYLVIDPVKIVKRFGGSDHRWMRAYKEAIGLPMCVIGWYGPDMYYTLMMDSLGKVYCGWDDALLFAGQTGEEAIENLLSGRERDLKCKKVSPAKESDA